jgi:uncharacterized membrane protein (DUF4010 family)
MENYFLTDRTLVPLMFKLGIAILIGLFIGVERERKKKTGEKSFAGIRTFPLIAILGFLSALMGSEIDSALFVAVTVVFGALVTLSYFFSSRDGSFGGTSEIAVLIIFTLGALVYWDYLILSASVAIMLAIFLTFKSQIRSFAGKIEEEDLYATIKFAIITLIVLPLLPNESFGPFSAFNPRRIWYMVILIAGISFVGYVLFKLIGTKRGIQLLSILGGLASSTAVTLSFTQRSKELPGLSRNLAAGIVLASTIMFPRVLLIVYVLNHQVAEMLLLPIGIFTAAGLITGLVLWRDTQKNNFENIVLKNPFKLMSAFKFGIIFAIILFVSKAAQILGGDGGIFVTSVFAGLADVDAITISVVDLVHTNLSLNAAVIAIIIGTTSNSIVKMIIAAFFGSSELRKYSFIGFSGMISASLIYIAIMFIF